jgi:hypothetical protein
VKFCLLAERGVLADQAILLCRSIRHFAGRYASAHITVISPRRERRPHREQIEILEVLGVDYVELELDRPVPEYGPSYRVLALAWCAERYGSDILVQLDSDTVFLGEPDIRTEEAGAAARPVDVTGMCSAGPDDPFDAIWQRMAKLCRVDLDAMPMLQTTVDKRRVRASYNAGLLFGPSKLYPLVAEFLVKILRDEIRPYPSLQGGIRSGAGQVSPEGSQFWGTSQAAISLALTAMNMSMRILGQDHNVPVHMLDEFSEPLLRVTHLHYHWMFAADSVDRVLQHLNIFVTADQRNWLVGAINRM